MNHSNLQTIHERYAQIFGNLADIAPPEIMFEPRLAAMMQAALNRGTALTETEVLAAFPKAAWERCE